MLESLLFAALVAQPVTRHEMADAVLWPTRVHEAEAPVATASRASSLSHTVFGYYPSYMGDDFSSIRFELLTHVGYFTGGCTTTGGYSQGNWPFDALVNAAHEKGTKVLLVVPCFGANKIDAILNDPAKRQAFIDAIVAAVSQGVAADGVDLDFEGMSAAQLGAFPDFAADVASAVRAVLPEAELSAALPAVDWSQAYDYPALAQVLDHLFIMGYGYHWKGSDPGAVAPLDYTGVWSGYTRDLQWSIDDYKNAIGDPALDHKVVLGLPYYGYDWPATSFDIPGTKTANATARFYASAVEMAGTGVQHDPDSQSAYFFYEDAGVMHQLWFDDATTLAMKFEAAKANGIGGVGMWALTYDAGHTELWDAIASSFTAATPDPEPTATPTTIDGMPGPQGFPGDAGGGPHGCAVSGARGSPLLALALLALATIGSRKRR